jgi:hypothetical protein
MPIKAAQRTCAAFFVAEMAHLVCFGMYGHPVIPAKKHLAALPLG